MQSRQKAVGRRHKCGEGTSLPTAYRLLPTNLNPGFTLIEMLIVIGVIILALAMAVPAIRALTGAKSEQAAQNVVSAYLASARADAVGIQDIEGVLFYLDPGTNRVTLVEVAQSPFQTNDVPGVIYLDLEGGVHNGKSRDPLLLPPGVRLMTIKDYGVKNDPFMNSRYLGFNYFPPAASPNAQLGGVILFNGNGRLYTGSYGFRFVTTNTTGQPTSSALSAIVFGNTTPSANWPPKTSNLSLSSQIAFTLFDRETFLNQGFLDNNDGGGSISSDVNASQANQDNWLDANTTPILVSRYNGTLIRAE